MDLFDLFASISLDTSDLESEIGDISGLSDDAADSLRDIGDAADDTEGSLSDLSDTAGDTGGDLDDLGGDAGDLGGDLDDLAGSADSLADSLDDAGSTASGIRGHFEDLGTSLGGIMTSGSSDASDAFGTFSTSLISLAEGDYLGSLTSLIEGLGTVAYNAAVDFQNAEAILAQSTGATGDDLTDMANVVREAYGDTVLTAQTTQDTVAAIAGELNTKFGLVGDALEECSANMSDYSVITGQDGVSATDKMNTIMNNWGLTIDDLGDLMDKFTVASQYSGASASDLEQIIGDDAYIFDEFGFSLDDAIGFLASYELAGGDASDAASFLEKAFNQLNGTTEDLPGALQDMIDAISNTDSVTEALNLTLGDTDDTISSVLGAKKASSVVQTLQTEQFAWEDATAAIEDSNGAMMQTAQDSQTWSDQMQSTWTGVKNSVIDSANDMIDQVDSFSDTEQYSAEVADTAQNTFLAAFASMSGGADAFASTIEQSAIQTQKNLEDTGTTADTTSTTITDSFDDTATGMGRSIDDVSDSLSGMDTDMEDASDTSATVSLRIVSSFEDADSGVASSTSGMESSLTSLDSAFEETAAGAEYTGTQLATGFQTGFDSQWPSVSSHIMSKVSSLNTQINDALDVHSPSKKTQYSGDMLAEGLDVGFTDEFEEVQEDIVDNISDLVDDVNDEVSDIGDADFGLDDMSGNLSSDVSSSINSAGSESAAASTVVNQYIYSQAQTAADLMREALYEQKKAVMFGV